MEQTLFLRGQRDVAIRVERKRIRNMYLHVSPGGRVSVSAPLGFTEEEIRRFVLEKSDWINRHVETLSAAEAPVSTYADGEVLSLWGRPLTIRVLPDSKKSFCVTDESVVLTLPPSCTEKERTDFVKGQLKQRLLRAIRMRMPYWEQKTGLYARQLRVREMKTRWGSCNTGNAHMTFNLSLIHLAPECLDYVLVHELVHLVHARHNAAFWSTVKRYIPEYARIKNDMNREQKEHAY